LKGVSIALRQWPKPASAKTVAFAPPTQGRWRATARYDGTQGSAPSEAGFVRMLVGGALRD